MQRACLFLVCHIVFKSKWTILYPCLFYLSNRNTEKQTGNVASAQNGCARTTLARQFKEHAAIARNNHNANFMHIPVLNCFLVIKNFLVIHSI